MEYVWVKPLQEWDQFELPFGARVLAKFRSHVKVRDDDGRELQILPKDVLRPMHPSCIKDVDDMIKLGDLQEYTILRNLQLRFKKNLIYTYIGNVLISVNPYQWLPIYGVDMIGRYQNRKLGELPPHLFAIGDISYQNMRYKEGKQCIIINGESGTGKTQTAKLLLQYYAAVTGKHSAIEEQVLQSNPIMEAFGNAKSVRNDNSSRFGKYIYIDFNSDGKMEQAGVKQFLLEKSRVVSQSKGERNFHIFYMLIRGMSPEEKKLIGLKDVSFYEYLSEEYPPTDDNRADITAFHDFVKALKVLDFNGKDTWKIFELLAAILHLGNVHYNVVMISGEDVVEVMDSWELNFISTIMGVSTHYLKSCLTKRTISTLNEKVSKRLNKQEAVYSRNAFVKAVYGNLFTFIVNKINEVIRKRNGDLRGYIGVLDVFGFENFECNSFEQLCINLANEHLQQFFIRHSFKLEQLQYIDEGIPWESVAFFDNKPIIELISIKPLNILCIINDQSKLPRSTDESVLKKLIEHHGENDHFLSPKFNNIAVFGIRHFAGVVLYDIKDFLEKNRDSYSLDFENLVEKSDNDFLKKIFSADLGLDAVCGSSYSSRRSQTSATKFKNSLNSLMIELNECHPFFVRCIKPNDLKKPNLFDRRICCKQLRYSGVWETAKIRQSGYAVRFAHGEFVVRYGMLKPGLPPLKSLRHEELKFVVRDVYTAVLKSEPAQQMGYTKIFLKNSEFLTLEKERERYLTDYVVILQKECRKWMCRKRYLALKKSTVTIQKYWRGRKPRKEYLLMCHGFMRLQAVINSRYLTVSFLYLRRFITKFQARCRGFVIRREFRQRLQVKKIEISRSEAKEMREVVDTSVSTGLHSDSVITEGPFENTGVTRNYSYLHRLDSRPVYGHHHIEDMSKVVDDSFDFLDHQHWACRCRNKSVEDAKDKRKQPESGHQLCIGNGRTFSAGGNFPSL